VETTDVSFDSLGLSPAILKSVGQLGFVHPTPIQSAIIPKLLEGKDVIGLAQTGSGKTAAFALPMAERLLHGSGLRGLILCPTREIALQTKAFLDLFGRHHRLNTVCLIGGVNINPQIRDLERRPDIVVATPGRLMDHVERKTVRLDLISELVLDEADHMLDMGFLPQIQRILQRLPRERHSMMFSATMPSSIEKLARLYLVDGKDKTPCLLGLLNQELGSTLVFTRTKRDANWLCRVLDKEGHPVTTIHSDRTQRERTHALKSFREGGHRILVATDIASRGIDVPEIEHIVNFNVPATVEEYIHRAGRTARAGAVGLVSTIATWVDRPMIRDIETALQQTLSRCSVPGVAPYAEIQAKPFARRPLRSAPSRFRRR